VASGAAAFAYGQNVEARGTNSFAAGIGTFALGNKSMSLGDYSIASGSGAISIGHGISQEIQLVGPANSTEYTLSTIKRVSASKTPGRWTGSSITTQEAVDTTPSYTTNYNVDATIPDILKSQ
jgi:hypothetical protein